MGITTSKNIDYSKNIFIKICPTYYQYNNYDNYLENKEKYIISYKKLDKNEIIKFMMKHLKKKDNYILNFDDNNNYMIKNIKLDKDYIIINVKYNNIKKNYNIKYYKSYIEDGFYKYFDSGDKKIINKCAKNNNIYFSVAVHNFFEVYQ